MGKLIDVYGDAVPEIAQLYATYRTSWAAEQARMSLRDACDVWDNEGPRRR